MEQNNSLEGTLLGEVVKGHMPVLNIADSRYNKGNCLGLQEKIKNKYGYGDILKMKIEDDECMSSNIMWTQKSFKTTNLRAAWIQTYPEELLS